MKTLDFMWALLLLALVLPTLEARRIIGGTLVKNISEVPYQLSLRINGYHKCGASVISSTWALSAGHCLYPELPEYAVTFLAGVITVNSPATKYIFDTAEFHRHPDYDKNNYDFDVAVARVTRSFFEVPLVERIRLSTQNMPLVIGEETIVAGWGVAETGSLSPDLLKVEVPIIANDDCRVFWGSKLTDRMICAGAAGSDSCVGDSGGPLVFRKLQVGIVSFGAKQCGSKIPAGYTAISHPSVRHFIRNWTGV